MATVTIRKPDGTQAGSLDLADAVFAVEPSLHSVRQTVAQYLAGQRAGTHSTRTRAFVSGGGKKPWRQKGTGRARQGSIRAVQWRHGAIAFGPLPRDYAFRVNRKVRAQAFRSVWSELVRNDRVIVIEDFGLQLPKTRQMMQLLQALGADGPTLIVTGATHESVALSARNIPWVSIQNAENLNVYDLLRHEWVVTTPDVLKRVEATYA
jgi:large subunit ribosomal protein L4